MDYITYTRTTKKDFEKILHEVLDRKHYPCECFDIIDTSIRDDFTNVIIYFDNYTTRENMQYNIDTDIFKVLGKL